MIVANTVLCAGEIWALVPVIFIAIVVVAVAVAVPALKKLVNSQNVQNVVDEADRVIQKLRRSTIARQEKPIRAGQVVQQMSKRRKVQSLSPPITPMQDRKSNITKKL